MKKILIVDDHSDIRHLMRLTLGSGFDVLETDNGSTALDIVRKAKPDLVILDIMMPGELSGLQVLDAIKADPILQEIIVILVTARGQVADHDDGIRRGAYAYFIKPFSPLQLALTINKALPI